MTTPTKAETQQKGRRVARTLDLDQPVVRPGTGGPNELDGDRAVRYESARVAFDTWHAAQAIPPPADDIDAWQDKIRQLLDLNVDLSAHIPLAGTTIDQLYAMRPAEALVAPTATRPPPPKITVTNYDPTFEEDVEMRNQDELLNDSGDDAATENARSNAPPDVADALAEIEVVFDDFEYYLKDCKEMYTSVKDGSKAPESAASHFNQQIPLLQEQRAKLRSLDSLLRRNKISTWKDRFRKVESSYVKFIDAISTDPKFANVHLSFADRPSTSKSDTWTANAASVQQKMQQTAFNVLTLVRPPFEGVKGRVFNIFSLQWDGAVEKMKECGYKKADYMRELRKVLIGDAANLVNEFEDSAEDYDKAIEALEETYRDEVEVMTTLFQSVLAIEKKIAMETKMGSWIRAVNALDRLESQLLRKGISMSELVWTTLFERSLKDHEKRDWKVFRAREVRDANKARAAALGCNEEDLPLDQKARDGQFQTRRSIKLFASQIASAADGQSTSAATSAPATSTTSTSNSSSSKNNDRDRKRTRSVDSSFHGNADKNRRNNSNDRSGGSRSRRDDRAGQRRRDDSPARRRQSSASGQKAAPAKQKCASCKNNSHETATCSRLDCYGDSEHDRLNLKRWLLSNGLCMKCFKPYDRHRDGECDASCDTCGKGHHKLLCGDLQRVHFRRDFKLPPPLGPSNDEKKNTASK